MSPAGPSGAGSLVPPSAWRRLMCIAYEGVLLFGVLFFFG